MSDLAAIQKAIEESNRAFESFKCINDDKQKTQGDKLAAMEKAFGDVQAGQAEIKKLVEDIEAKGRRFGTGGAGKTDDEILREEHKAAFAEWARKGGDGRLANLTEIESKAYAITTNSGADGGSAVPKVIDSAIESFVVNVSPIRQIAKVTQTSTNDYHRLVNVRGTASSVVAETGSRAATNTSTLKDITINQYDIYANPQATQQVLDDVFFNFEQWIAEEIGTEFARQEGQMFVSGAGSGSSQPQGFLTPTYVSTDDASRTFGQCQYVPTGVSGGFASVSSTVNPADILFTLVGKMKAMYRSGSVWVMNKNTLFTIAAFKDNQGRYVFNPIQSPNVPATLLGYPVYEAEDMPAIAANSLSVAFGNFQRGYEIVDRVGSTRVTRDPFSNKPYIGFYTVKRVGGAVINSEAIKALKFSVS